MQPSAEQLESYARDGFLVVERWLEPEEVERLRERFHRCFAHEWATGLQPDEVNYDPATSPPDRTRQLCNVWKADTTLAATVLAERIASFGAQLAGLPGLRLIQDNMIWKPPSGKALLCHQDAAYLEFLTPKNMTTCWMALDDTYADSGTIYYARGSHLLGRLPTGGQFHAPDDWRGHMHQVLSPEALDAVDWVPIEVPAGGAAFHDGWVWHGSPPNERGDRERRAIISHMITTRTIWHPTNTHSLYSHYRRPGETELDEAFFPVMWREDGYRTRAIDEAFAVTVAA